MVEKAIVAAELHASLSSYQLSDRYQKNVERLQWEAQSTQAMAVGPALEEQERHPRGAGGALRKAPLNPPTPRQPRQRHRWGGVAHRWMACWRERANSGLCEAKRP